MVKSRPIWMLWPTSPSFICTLSRSASLMPKPSRRPTYSWAISTQRFDQPSQRMQWVSRAGPHLHHFQAVAETAEHVVVVHFEAVEFELAMAAVLFRAHDLDAADDAPAGLVLMKQKRGDAPALVVGGARRENKMRGAVGAGD